MQSQDWTLTGRHGHERLYGPPRHHADHHDGEDGDGVARHVHDEQVHGDLLQGPEGNVPATLYNRETEKEVDDLQQTRVTVTNQAFITYYTLH